MNEHVVCDLPVARLNAYALKDILKDNFSADNFHASKIHFTTVRQGWSFKLDIEILKENFPINVECLVNFEIVYKTEFRSVIRGQRVFKINWFSVINEKLDFKKNDREEALSCNQHTVEVYLIMEHSLVIYQLNCLI